MPLNLKLELRRLADLRLFILFIGYKMRCRPTGFKCKKPGDCCSGDCTNDMCEHELNPKQWLCSPIWKERWNSFLCYFWKSQMNFLNITRSNEHKICLLSIWNLFIIWIQIKIWLKKFNPTLSVVRFTFFLQRINTLVKI